MLDKQYHLYSVDTGHFYSGKERYLHNMNCKYRQERNFVKNKAETLSKQLVQDRLIDEKSVQKLSRKNLEKLQEYKENNNLSEQVSELIDLYGLIIHKREKAKESKDTLLRLLENKIQHNIDANGADHIRNLDATTLNDNNVVSMFDSFLSRTLKIEEDELTDNLIIVQIYYFDVFKDISSFGFTYKGEKYRYFTSSAGQIRKKKAVFIKESVWQKYEKTLMCGLTIDEINAKGGINTSKFLAYLALTNTASDEWKEFDIDKCIVVEDFETNVWGTYDFIDETDYSITRKTDYVPIPHTDGAGMILPNAFGQKQKNTMVRMPWIKGLISVFPFDKFISEHENDSENPASRKINDIYGKEWDIFEDDIQVIFTKSQFKLWKYYENWQCYKDNYKRYGCTAGRCNIEEDRVKNAKINYQMLQTLTDIADEEIDILTKPSADRIKNICTSKESMLDILGVTPYNTNPTPFQKAIKMYPALLGDTYCKDIIREVKNSLLKKYRSGKLEVKGKYAFALPDFYAACEYWFCGIQEPKGLLDDGEVFCWLTRFADKVDCLRSPHLYREHPVRKNIAHSSYGERAEKLREWYQTNGIYNSTHDLITKIVMSDFDGDKYLVVSDKDFVKIAERNMQDIVPLYYNMQKALPVQLTSESIYKGLITAFTGGNIGVVSNDISKIWNSDAMLSGDTQKKTEALDCIKRLCCQNNQIIDYAKTLYKTTPPKEINDIMLMYTNTKLPAFFEYAKDKKPKQVCSRNNSFVNKIYSRVKDKGINFKHLGIEPIDYKLLMRNPDLVCSKEVAETYDRLNRQYRFMLNMKDEHIDNLRYVACRLREEFSAIGYSNEMLTDMLVEYLYGRDKRYKQVLWFCYGQYIVNNISQNISIPKKRVFQCIGCGEWFEVYAHSTKIMCDACADLSYKERYKKYNKKRKK